MKLLFLGTGTSTGVPMVRCQCPTCTSADPRDKRLRSSVLVFPYGVGHPAILIDCGPDFRQQMLAAGSPDIACAFLTHTHYDHVGGVDDLRPYAYTAPKAHFPLFCGPDVAADLRSRVPYCFTEKPYPGVPQFNITEIYPGCTYSVRVGDKLPPIDVEVLRVIHGRLPILGFRIGRMAYITDASELPQRTLDRLKELDVLVVNALREKTHPTHLNLEQALSVVSMTAPRRALLTHMSHDMPPQAFAEALLPAGVSFASDGLSIDIDTD